MGRFTDGSCGEKCFIRYTYRSFAIYPRACHEASGLPAAVVGRTGNRAVCTLIALNHCIPGASLVIAANRDEYLDRPSEGPALRATPYGAIVAPRDGRAGGTWLGMNAAGVFAALTNRPTKAPNARARSRGLLVTDALQSESAPEALERLKIDQLDAESYNPFNLLVADAERCFLVTHDGLASASELGVGAHVIGNSDPAALRTPKLAALDRAVRRATEVDSDRVLDVLTEICASHGGNGDVLGDACVHAGEYGTLSSTLLRVGDSPQDDVLKYADGAPCCTRYDDFTPLLHDLRRESGYVQGATATRSIS